MKRSDKIINKSFSDLVYSRNIILYFLKINLIQKKLNVIE